MRMLLVILQVIFLEGVLSIDNAAVLGAMVAHLPPDKPVPWPRLLRPIGQALDPLLGEQKTAALRVGLLGAYLGRGLMLLLAGLVMENRWLRVLGGLYLVRLAAENLGSAGRDEAASGDVQAPRSGSFWATVATVELADLTFSLDNVVAVVALSRQLWVVMAGVALGILLMRFAAGVFSVLVEREPVLAGAAYVLVLNIGAELLAEEVFDWHIDEFAKFAISAATILLALGYARVRPLQVAGERLRWLRRALGLVAVGFDLALWPFAAAFAALRSMAAARGSEAAETLPTERRRL